MRSLVLVLQNLGRLLGLVLLVLGFLFWSHHSYQLIPIHISLGVAFVVLLWTLALLGMRAGVKAGLVVASFLVGVLVIGFGMTMGRMLPGPAHEAIRVIHFLIGLAAIGLLESLGARIKRSPLAVR